MRRQEANDDDRMSETDEVRQDIDDVRCKVQSRSVRVCVVSELMNRQVELERARKRQSASQPASAVTAARPKGKAARALSTFVLFFGLSKMVQASHTRLNLARRAREFNTEPVDSGQRTVTGRQHEL